jgi:hypothetical protein
VDAARRHVEANRASSKAGRREWELSRGFLYCGGCGRSMNAVVTRDAKYGSEYHYYACPEPRNPSPAAPSRCPNRRSHRAAALERDAARLFQENAGSQRLLELYERAVREEERLGGRGAAERHEKLSGEMEALNAERRGYLRLAARDAISDAELDDLLAEVDGKRQRVASDLRAAEAALARKPAYPPLIHGEWETDPDAILPSEWLTAAASVEQTRAAYRRYNVRFVVGADGTLSMRMELPLGGPGDGPGEGVLINLTTTPRRSTRDRPRPRTPR